MNRIVTVYIWHTKFIHFGFGRQQQRQLMTTAGRPPRKITIQNHSPRGNNPKVKRRNNTIRPHQMSWNGLNIFYVNLLDMLVNLFEIRSEFSYFLRSKCDAVASAVSSFAVRLGNISTICFVWMLVMIVNRHLPINEFITWFPFECVWTCQGSGAFHHFILSHYTACKSSSHAVLWHNAV